MFNIWLYYDYKHKLDRQNEINDYLISEIEEVRSWLYPIQHLSNLRNYLLSRLDIIQTLTTEYKYRSELFSLLVNSTQGVTLHQLATTGTDAKLYGTADSSATLHNFIKALKDSSLCEHDIQPVPGKTPGSFEILCFHGEEYD